MEDKRIYLIGCALQGMLSSAERMEKITKVANECNDTTWEVLATISIKHADAILERLENGN